MAARKHEALERPAGQPQTVGMRTVGVEEEFLLVDADHGRPIPAASRALRAATERGIAGGEVATGALVHELQEQQLEVYTSPHDSMASLEAELRAWRAVAASAAAGAGARLVASATSPVRVEPQRVRDPRYDRMAERFGIVTDEQLTCGCHVHVSVRSTAEAVGVLDRIRVWLPALLALSANSPFWQGRDTGYASFRIQALGRWPVSGPTELFQTAMAYEELVEQVLAAEVVLDRGMLYFDARASHRFPTVEVRVTDVCLDVRDTVLIAALCRALVETSAASWAAGEPPPQVSAVLLRLATWHASRWGIGAGLLDPLTARPLPAAEVVGRLVDEVRPALRRSGDDGLVAEGVDRILQHGNGATWQRDVFARSSSLDEVVAGLARATSDDRG